MVWHNVLALNTAAFDSGVASSLLLLNSLEYVVFFFFGAPSVSFSPLLLLNIDMILEYNG